LCGHAAFPLHICCIRRSYLRPRPQTPQHYIPDCVYSRILCAHYRLEQIEPFLEVPLDGIVGVALVKAACDCGQLRRLPRWRTIKGLTREDSDTYQAFASELAEEKGLARVHLDVVLWGAR